MQRRFVVLTWSLPLVLALAAGAAACSNAVDGTSTTRSPTTPAGGEPEADAGSGAATPATDKRPLADSVAPEIVSTLRTAGFTLDALPDLESLHETGHPRMRAIMKTFTIALGTTCDGCHVPKAVTDEDFRVDTPRKNVARKMYARFVGELQKKDGTPIYCDTCHQGSITFLDRTDDGALRTWMQSNLVDRLARKDGKKAHGCDTCHGTPFAGKMLSPWRQ